MDNTFQTGISGMLANQTWMDAIGNNIANASTTGYKSQQVEFSDTINQMLQGGTAPSGTLGGVNPIDVGTGVAVASTNTNYNSGSLQSTGRTTDIAIDGSGFIAVTDGTNIYYTRDGGLGLDANGNLVQLSSGLKVVAAAPNTAAGSVNVTPSSTVQLPVGQTSAAKATSSIALGGNINSDTTATTPTVTATIYDSLGAAHNLTLTFTSSGTANTWNVSGTVDGGTVSMANSQVSFDSSGNPQTSSLSLQIALNGSTGAAQSMNVTTSLSNVTQLAATSGVALQSQNGLAPGTLTGISFGTGGNIIGTYSNGLTSAVGQLVTASFSNDEGLQSLGSNLYSASVNSGSAQYSTPGTNGLGAVKSGELEGSNVNLTQELSDMIIAQQGFQAASKTITSQDQMIQSLLSIGQ